MALSHRNGIALSGLSAINGVSAISAINGISAALGGGDVTPPLQNGAWTIGTDGDTHTLAFSENVVIGAGGSGGFTANMSGGAVTLTYVSGTGTTSLVFTGSRTVGDDETQTGSNGAYTQPGNGIEDAAGNDLATFTGHTITNNSTVDQTAPTLSTATVATNGTTLTLVFSEAVTRGAGYADADLDVDASTTGANLGLTYVSGDGTDTFVYTIASTIQSGETVDLDFNGDANSLEDGAGNDLAAIVSGAVTNNSTQGGFVPTDIASLKVWLKSESLSGSEGADVTAWADSSGNGYDASTDTGFEPALNLNALGSFSAIRVTRTGDELMRLTGSALGIINNVSGVTVCLVWRKVTGTHTSGGIFQISTASTNPRAFFQVGNPSTGIAVSARRLDTDTTATTSAATSPATNDWTVLSYGIDYSTGNAYIWNGNTEILAAEPLLGTTGNTSATDSGFIRFGASGVTGIDAQHAEVLVFNTFLSDTDRNNVIDFLQSKFSL